MTDSIRTLDEAISAHIAEHFPDALVDSWVIVTHAQTLTGDNISNYRLISHREQPFHVDAGLLQVGTQIITDSWAESFDDEDDA